MSWCQGSKSLLLGRQLSLALQDADAPSSREGCLGFVYSRRVGACVVCQVHPKLRQRAHPETSVNKQAFGDKLTAESQPCLHLIAIEGRYIVYRNLAFEGALELQQDRMKTQDENTSPSEREAAEGRVAENTDELARLEPQIQEREEALPLRERVKNIFKKYGWTLQALALAVGIVLSALALAGLNGLKAGTKAVGQGLKAIGEKLGSLLPGLIGSIVSFIFKAAGQVFVFLAEHAWLLILSVVAFFMEKLLKRRRKQ